MEMTTYKQHFLKGWLGSFLRGMGRSISVAPLPRRRTTIERSLADDWNTVGADLWTVILSRSDRPTFYHVGKNQVARVDTHGGGAILFWMTPQGRKYKVVSAEDLAENDQLVTTGETTLP